MTVCGVFLVSTDGCMAAFDDQVCHEMSFRLGFSRFLKGNSTLYVKIVYNWKAEKPKNCDGAGER